MQVLAHRSQPSLVRVCRVIQTRWYTQAKRVHVCSLD